MLNKLIAAILFLSFAFTALAQENKGCSSDKKNGTTTEKIGCTSEGSSSCCTKGTDKNSSEVKMKTENEQSALKEKVKTETASAKPWNTICPVMGNEIDIEVKTVQYNGKEYGFCCEGCDDKFQKDPQSYSKNLSDDGTKFIGEK